MLGYVRAYKPAAAPLLSASVVEHRHALFIFIMSSFQHSQYEAIPVDEKVEDDQQDSLKTSPVKKKRNSAFVGLVICLIAFASLFAFLGTARSTQGSLEHNTEEAAQDDPASYFMEAARATNQQYLLGVGKADITGSVFPLCPGCH